jgi:hypothetical protein
MPNRAELLRTIAGLIGDYRQGEVAPLGEGHIDQWLQQFPPQSQGAILEEVAHVLSKTYFSKKNVLDFLSLVVASKNFAGDDPCTFWRGVKFLHLQTVGNSQREMLTLFEDALREKCGLSLADCGAQPHTFVYLDDVLFSGGRIKSDVIRWIKTEAPNPAKLAVVTIGLHLLGQFFAKSDIAKAITESGKAIEVTWWRMVEIEDRKSYMYTSDVLRPTAIPADQATQAYVAGLGAAPILRTPGGVGKLGVFSSEAARGCLEQEFLVAGVRVREMCPHLNAYRVSEAGPHGVVRL